MKKTAIVLALVMLLSLTLPACAQTENLVGLWYIELDISEYVNENFIDPELREYAEVSRFVFQYLLRFNEDGTYRFEAAFPDAEEMYHWTREAYRIGLEQYYQNQMTQTGVNMPVNEYLKEKDTSLDALIEETFPITRLYELMKPLYKEGRYKAKGGKLFLSTGLDVEPDSETYEAYALKDQVLTVTSGSMIVPKEYVAFPVMLLKIG